MFSTLTLAQGATAPSATLPSAPVRQTLGLIDQISTKLAGAIARAAGLEPDTVQPLTALVVKVCAAILLLIAAWMVAGWVQRLLKRLFARTDLDETLERFFANAARWVVLIIGVLICMEAFGVSATSVVALLTTAGVAIGLALQGSLSHFASGVMLLIFRPFKVGDVVTIAGNEGTVDAIDLFTTTIDTGDNRRIIIPNSQVFGSVIINQTFHDRRLVTLKVPISGGADIAVARRELLAAATRVASTTPGALTQPAPGATLTDAAGNQVWALSVWAQPAAVPAAQEALVVAAKEAIDAHNLGVTPPVSIVRTSA
jgi:small conductance mechanosensitive channel